MAPLKSLERDYPIIDSEFQHFCAFHGIFTVEDFLIHDLNALVMFVWKQPNSERLKQGIDQICFLLESMHRPWLNGVALLKDAQQNKQNKHVFSIGNEGIDSFLHDGLREGRVIELVGPSSSGKTQVCLRAAASVAKLCEGGVVFLDTGNSFSVHRIACFVSQNSNSTSIEGSHETFEKVMSNISCCRVYDIFGLLDVLHQLECKLKCEMQAGDHLVRLLIIDSLSSLITPILGGGGPNGHALMISAGFLLKKLAHEYSLCVLVTNHMVGGEGGLPKPALGESWKGVPHVRLLLSRDHRASNGYSFSMLKY
ncbi:hypothetical protein Nepgr_000067 [Nepenthes gracilis]|uniref:RecA family profile 1 domain-containing protein n=1 Tax=Nepenthes gracilis TaxID=150966 RepID=A0AAD3P327_NEPGR|nr:hypothetical protein Nepgr_000067 [Nepenthes gracilis]